MRQEADPLIPIDFADRIGRRRRKQSKHSPSQPRRVCPRFAISKIQGDVLSVASRANSLRYLGDESFVGDAISQDQVSQEESQ